MKRSVAHIGLSILCIVVLSGCLRFPRTMSSLPDDVTAQLDDAIATKMAELNLPSVVVGIWIPNKGRYVSVSGQANLDTETPRRLCSPFRIASITKMFTATAVLQLADQGRLDTSDLLSKYLPDFPNADKITVRDLLRMRSGIPDFADEDLLAYLYENPLADLPVSKEIALSAAQTDKFEEPDRKTVYSNVNYIILGEIVRLVTGEDIGKRIERCVLKPLRLRHTSYPHDTKLPGRLRGYSWNAATQRFDDTTVLNPLWAAAGGGMISTLDDLRVFARALYRGDLLSDRTQAARLETMPFEGSNGLLQYGEGIATRGKFWGHDGTIFGFSTEIWYLPEKDAVLAINVNRLDEDDRSMTAQLFKVITQIAFPEDVDW